jgi:hypothetical protein
MFGEPKAKTKTQRLEQTENPRNRMGPRKSSSRKSPDVEAAWAPDWHDLQSQMDKSRTSRAQNRDPHQ